MCLLSSTKKGGRTRKRQVSILLYGIFYELEPLAPLLLSIAAIIGLFFGIDLIFKLEIKVF